MISAPIMVTWILFFFPIGYRFIDSLADEYYETLLFETVYFFEGFSDSLCLSYSLGRCSAGCG